jgi:serine phosphatase RsbU (regulator of sigma subunit)
MPCGLGVQSVPVMTDEVDDGDGPGVEGLTVRRRRADAEQNFSRIVEQAVRLLRADPRASVEQIADASGLSRATVYRHFPTRQDLVGAARQQAADDSGADEHDEVRPAGGPAVGEPPPLDLADVLNKVPPHLLGEQIVAETQRIAGVSSVALYVVDIDGSRLLRLAGSREFPAELRAPLAVGPEIAREGIANLRRMIEAELPNSEVAPLYLRGRAIGVLLAVDAAHGSLDGVARQAAAAIDLASLYTDVFAIRRRHAPTSAAAEIQQNLLPPRIVRMSGAALAGNVLPGYDVGGDWFDYTENADAAWLAVADAAGRGAAAAGLAAIALGAFRAARRSRDDIEHAVAYMDETVRAAASDGGTVTAIIGRWHGPSSTFGWINCGHPAPVVVSPEGRLEELGPAAGALGAPDGEPDLRVTRRRLIPGERLVLYSDGVTERPTLDGRPFGLEGIRRAVARASSASAPATVRAIEDAVADAAPGPLEDDATLLVLVPSPVR